MNLDKLLGRICLSFEQCVSANNAENDRNTPSEPVCPHSQRTCNEKCLVRFDPDNEGSGFWCLGADFWHPTDRTRKIASIAASPCQ
jgi:hypothetical protein